SMSETATLTRVPGALRTASMTFAGVTFCGIALPLAVQRLRAIDKFSKEWHFAGMPAHRSPPHVSPGAALAACHVAVALFGFAGVFGKWIAWDPVAIVLGRTTVAAVVLAFFVRYRPIG